MKYEVILTDNFILKLDNILEYLKVTFSEQVADNYFEYLFDQLRNLEVFPNIGKTIEPSVFHLDPNKAFISKQNIVFYRIDEESRKIFLITIVSSNENYLNLIN